MAIITTTVDATRPIGSDNSGDATHGIRANLLLLKNRVNSIVTDLNSLQTQIDALPDLPTSGATGLSLLSSATVDSALTVLDFSAFIKLFVGAGSEAEATETLGLFNNASAGFDKGTIYLGQSGLKLNWFNMNITGSTEILFHTPFTTRILFYSATSNHYPSDGSWGRNLSIFIEPIDLTKCRVDTTRGGSKSIFAVGV
jgi:hypothetical protein